MAKSLIKILGRIIAITLLTAVFFILISFALRGVAEYRQNTWAKDYGQIIIPREGLNTEIKSQSIIEVGESAVIGAHYPQTGGWDIDNEIASMVIGRVKAFKELLPQGEKGLINEYHLDYETISLNKQIISFIFEENTLTKAAGRVKRVFSLCYDLENSEPLNLGWFFVPNSQYGILLAEISKEKLSAAEGFKGKDGDEGLEFFVGEEGFGEDFFTFGFAPQGLCLYYDSSRVEREDNRLWEVFIPYEELLPFCRINSGGNFYQPPERLRKTEIDPKKPMVALTFDDGPSDTVTPRLLEALKERDVLATFFILGNRAQKYPALITKMDTQGHEIGSHGYDHIHAFTTLNSEKIKEQLNKTKEAVLKATGKEPTLLRPPYGAIDKKSAALIDTPIIMWNIDSSDWKSRNPEKIKEQLIKAKNGDIILMHDLYESSLEGVILGIEALKEKGIQFVTVSELFEYKGIEAEAGKIYYYAK